MTVTEQDIKRAREWFADHHFSDGKDIRYNVIFEELAAYAAHITAERDVEIARLSETFVDDRGVVWRSPTAEAYYRVCRALDTETREAACLRDEMAELKQRFGLLRSICEEFVHRVDIGEVRSKRTYSKIKEALSDFDIRKDTNV